MAVEIVQAYENFPMSMISSGVYKTAEITYKVFNVEGEEAALLAVMNYIEKTYNGLALDDVKADERLTETSWQVVATYKESSSDTPESADVAEETYSFQIGGGTTHITQSKKTEKYGRDGVTPPDLGHAIGWDGEKAAGVDIYVPTFTFKISKWFNTNQLDTAYQKNIASVVDRVNAKPFRGFATGEVLFLNVEGSFKKSDSITELTFYFMASMNLSNYKVGDITVKLKPGWYYQWTVLSKKTDTASKSILPQVEAVYLERVYDYVDFGKLKLD